MPDALLERLTAPANAASRARFVTPDWPAELKLKSVRINRDPNGPMLAVDTIVCMWTAAEKQAVADVFGVPESQWNFYAKDFNTYLPDLTGRSPAKEMRRLAEYAVVTQGDQRIGLLHLNLHLATDSTALPLRRLIGQIIRDTGCKNWVDTGTSGGVDSAVVVGDTVVASNLIFDCTGAFKDESYAHQSFATTADLSHVDWTIAAQLMEANAALLKPQTERAPKVWIGHDLATCDSFLFDMKGDPFGLEKYDSGNLLCEEMDAATLGLVAQDLGSAMPKYCSLRSVSDPQMPGGSVQAEKRAASKIYDVFGFAAQVETSVACVQAVASLSS